MKTKTNYRRLPARFEPETRFELRPVPTLPFRAYHENELERLKIRLLTERLEGLWKPALNSYVRRAANEAAALAWVTPYPLLFFPALFEELTEAALRRAEHQDIVRKRSLELLAMAI
jgi:hypothetical protein